MTRIYAHWSSDESHLLRYLNEVISYHLLPPDSLDDCSRISIPEGEKRIRCLFPSFKSSELLPLIFDELCGRPDMIGFVKYISEGVGVNGRTLLSNGGHDNARLCSQIIEPICQRLDSVSSSGKVPVALRCMIISIVGQTHDDDRRRNDLLLLFANSFISRITRWLFNSNSQQSLSDDCMSIGEQAHLLETVQELLKLCFIKGSSSIDSHASPSRGQIPLPGSSESNSLHSRIIGSNFSLQTHAILSRSRWLISRYDLTCLTLSVVDFL